MTATLTSSQSAVASGKQRIFNFGAGPAMLPEPVMQRIQEEFLNFQGIGASVVEISHRSKEFEAVVDRAIASFRELTGVGDDYAVLFVTGGARLQFSAVPMNLIGRSAARKALYVESGVFSALAAKDAAPYGDVEVIASSKAQGFDRIPEIDPERLAEDAAYLHITTNNTVYGTRWNRLPQTGKLVLVGDMTSEILSRTIDFQRFGLFYAGLQKNLGVSGVALVAVRKDLLGSALPCTPPVLNYALLDKSKSMVNTPSTFAIYVTGLVLEWMKEKGGVAAVEKENNQKAELLYAAIDGSSGFYRPVAQPADRSTMNVTFKLPSEELTDQFIKGAAKQGLKFLKGYRDVGGIRASIYNAMPLVGVEALVGYMREFVRSNG